MFVYTEEDTVLNLKLVKEIFTNPAEENQFSVVARQTNDRFCVLRYFRTEENALIYLKDLYFGLKHPCT